MTTEATKTIAAYIAVGVSVLLWALSFANVIDRDAVPMFAIITLGLGLLAWKVSENAHEWPERQKASVYLFAWIFFVVVALGVVMPNSDCYVDWDGRSNSTACR